MPVKDFDLLLANQPHLDMARVVRTLERRARFDRLGIGREGYLVDHPFAKRTVIRRPDFAITSSRDTEPSSDGEPQRRHF